jgi:ribonuclease HI
LNIKVHKHPKWNKTPYPINRSQNTSPQLPNFPQNQHQKFPPQYCYYTNISFIPPKKLSKNIWKPIKAGYGISNPLLKINISRRLLGLQNILRAQISAIYHTLVLILKHEFPQEPAHFFTDSLNSLYLINTQIKHPTQQNNHPDKTALALIVKLLKNCSTPTTLHKVRAHTNNIGNEEANKLAKEDSKIDPENDMPTQSHENAHSTPYWWCRDDDHPYL